MFTNVWYGWRQFHSPIASYHQRGTLGRNDAAYHAIIYGYQDKKSTPPPQPFTGENLNKKPIRMVEAVEALNEASRVNFSQVYTVQHNVKVKKCGKVHDDDLSFVKRYYKDSVTWDWGWVRWSNHTSGLTSYFSLLPFICSTVNESKLMAL